MLLPRTPEVVSCAHVGHVQATGEDGCGLSNINTQKNRGLIDMKKQVKWGLVKI